MNYKYDEDMKELKRKSIYEEEINLIKELIKSDHKNICFEYQYSNMAHTVGISLRNYIKTNKLPLKIHKQGCKIFVVKEGVK